MKKTARDKLSINIQPETNSMNIFKYTAAGFLCLAVSVACTTQEKAVQEEAPAVQEKPSLYTSQSMTINAVVEAVDYETREVTLRDPQGESYTFTAGPEVRNLAQVNPGDIVTTEVMESLSIEVYDNPGMVPGAGEIVALGTAELGEKPGMTAIDTQVVTATVEAINLEANTFILKWPDGSLEQFTAQNPENLRKAAVGDLVIITKSVTLIISVEEAQAE